MRATKAFCIASMVTGFTLTACDNEAPLEPETLEKETSSTVIAEVVPDALRPTYQDPQDPNVRRYVDNDRLVMQGDVNDLPEHLQPDLP